MFVNSVSIRSLQDTLTWRFAGLPTLILKTPAAYVLLSLRERMEVLP